MVQIWDIQSLKGIKYAFIMLIKFFQSSLSAPKPSYFLAFTVGLLVLSRVVVYFLTLLAFKRAVRTKKIGKRPPVVPYYTPFIRSLFPLAWNPVKFVNRVLRWYGHDVPIMIKAGTFKFCLVANSEDVRNVLQSPKVLDGRPAAFYVMDNLFGTPKRTMKSITTHALANSMKTRKESTREERSRIDYWQSSLSHKYLSGQSLKTLSHKFMSVMKRDMDKLRIGKEWFQIPDLHFFLQEHVAHAMIESIMGPSIFEQYPTLVEDFWDFDSNIATYSQQIPRFWKPEAYKIRDRLLEKIDLWRQFVHSKSDCSKTGTEDPDYDDYLGSKWMRAREYDYMRLPGTDRNSAASAVLGLIFGANSNAVTTMFWYLFEALRDIDLQRRMVKEAALCHKDGNIDLAELCSQPLLQSAFAEVLRNRVSIAITRMSLTDDFQLGDYSVPNQVPIALFTQVAAYDREAWSVRPRCLNRPLEDFWAERFLVPTTDERAGRHEDAESKTAIALDSVSEPQMRFKTDALEACWLPFGGGKRMCPGRHFAKNAILGTFALFFCQYECELNDAEAAESVEPDSKRFMFTALPPANMVPVRIRKL
ncbi:MAG: hypothetical protein Q9160_009052 [Pyrenula sp. 1 TL-2023]